MSRRFAPGKDVKEEERADLYVAIEGVDPKFPSSLDASSLRDKVLADHPLLSKAMVNRMWGWMMGRGIVHPVDSLDSYHPVSHPELLHWLASEFAHSNYDVRRLIKALATSDAYQYASESKGASIQVVCILPGKTANGRDASAFDDNGFGSVGAKPLEWIGTTRGFR